MLKMCNTTLPKADIRFVVMCLKKNIPKPNVEDVQYNFAESGYSFCSYVFGEACVEEKKIIGLLQSPQQRLCATAGR